MSVRPIIFVGSVMLIAMVCGCRRDMSSEIILIESLFTQLKLAVVADDEAAVSRLVVPESQDWLRRYGAVKHFSEFKNGPSFYSNRVVKVIEDDAHFYRGNSWGTDNSGSWYLCKRVGTNWYITTKSAVITD